MKGYPIADREHLTVAAAADGPARRSEPGATPSATRRVFTPVVAAALGMAGGAGIGEDP
jgi:hypothetical protein